MNWLIEIIVLILRALLPAVVEEVGKSRIPTSEDAAPQPELKRRLQERIRKTWGAAAVVILLCFCVGCVGNRTVYVPDGTPVRLRETIRDAKVWVLDKNLKPIPGVMDLPEGWYCLPGQYDDGVEE